MTSNHRPAGTRGAQVLVDLRWSQGQPAGIGRYIMDLAVALNEQIKVLGLVKAGKRPSVAFEVTQLPDLPNFRFDLLESVMARRTRLPLITLSRLPVLLAREQAIPMIFDLSPLILPKTHPAVRGFLERQTYPVAATANTIITLSQTSRRDLQERLSVDRRKICVVVPGRPAIEPEEQGPARLRQLGIRGDYVLAVGTLEPRKNLAVLIEAFTNRLRQEAVQLVVAGGLGWKYRRILQQMDSLRLAGKLLYLGYVSDADKALLYRHAVCLAYPSLYEGFGLPILEAMTYGTAAVVSSAPACVEVIGLAGFTLDPNDSGGWSDAIFQLLRDPRRRAELGKLGQERATQFTWPRSIAALVERLTGADASAAA